MGVTGCAFFKPITYPKSKYRTKFKRVYVLPRCPSDTFESVIEEGIDKFNFFIKDERVTNMKAVIVLSPTEIFNNICMADKFAGRIVGCHFTGSYEVHVDCSGRTFYEISSTVSHELFHLYLETYYGDADGEHKHNLWKYLY